MPTTCNVCKLCLVSAPHLARSYHHLFPPAESDPCIPDDESGKKPDAELMVKERQLFELIDACVGCGFIPMTIDEGRQFVKCRKCENCLCSYCDTFIDNNLIL